MFYVLEDWLSYLEKVYVEEIHLDLDNIKQVFAKLGLKTLDAPIILVGGTNGKGTTTALLTEFYYQNGYKVGTYTSPHLLRFNERIKINNIEILDAKLCEIFNTIAQVKDGIVLSFFEMATLAAFYYFKESKLDIIILEVGLGGRLDATNIINPSLAIVTNVDLDHQNYLGNTIEAIAYEKAHIFRGGIPCIYGDYNPPKTLLSYAESIKADLYCLGEDYVIPVQDGMQVVNLHSNNVAAAIAASTLLKNLSCDQQIWDKVLSNITVPARQELRFLDDKTVILDVAHNPQAVTFLKNFVMQHKGHGKVHAVFSALQDKDIVNMIANIVDVVDFWYPTALATKRAATQHDIIMSFQKNSCDYVAFYDNPDLAIADVLNRAKSYDTILFFGSFYLINAVLLGNKL
jgi:dihydrofolate synthase / folylpolyglutamate synthase